MRNEDGKIFLFEKQIYDKLLEREKETSFKKIKKNYETIFEQEFDQIFKDFLSKETIISDRTASINLIRTSDLDLDNLDEKVLLAAAYLKIKHPNGMASNSSTSDNSFLTSENFASYRKIFQNLIRVSEKKNVKMADVEIDILCYYQKLT